MMGIEMRHSSCTKMLFCTNNDFLAYANLSGYSVKGHCACPICEKGISYV